MKVLILFLMISSVTFLSAEIPKNSYSRFRAEYDSTGVLVKCRLKKAYEIDNILCRDWLRFYSDGSLKQCELAERTEVQGLSFPKHTILFFREDGSIHSAWISQNLDIKGIPCKGGWSKIESKFYSGGQLQSCFLYQDCEIQEIPCKASLFDPVIFFENGKLKQATLSRNFQFEGILYEKGTTLAFENENAYSPKKVTR